MSTLLQRKKQLAKAQIKKKTVRIDSRTLIEVAVNIPDEEARAHFLERNRSLYRYPYTPNYPVKEEFKDIPVLPVEDLEDMIENEKLTEIE
jgi:hypothetical protein